MKRESGMTVRLAIAYVAVFVLLLRQCWTLAKVGIAPMPPQMDWLNVDWTWYRDGMERVLAGLPLYDQRLLDGPFHHLSPEFEFTWEQAPSALVVIAPFYVLPELVRSSVFFVFSTACAFAAVWLVWPRDWSVRAQLLLSLLLAPALWAFVYPGNLITLTALGVALVVVGERRKSTSLLIAGLLCAGVIKILPAVVLGAWLLSRGRIKAVLLAFGLGILTLLPAVLYQGPQVLLDFMTVRGNILTLISNRVFTPRVLAYHLGFDLPQFVVSLAGVVLLVLALWPKRSLVTAILILQLAAFCFVTNLWAHWLFLLLIAGLAWASVNSPQAMWFEKWLRKGSDQSTEARTPGL